MKASKDVPVSILFCAATRNELDTFGFSGVGEGHKVEEVEPGCLWRSGEDLFFVTGVGTPETLRRLIPVLERHRPDGIVNTGIAGAYIGSGLEIGEVVLGLSEVFADLGLEVPSPEVFAPLGEQPFADESQRDPIPLFDPGPDILNYRRGRGATVNMCSGTDETGARRRRLFGTDFESMEGAAVALAARDRKFPVVEIRAISNFAARRDMKPENIRSALDTLSTSWKQDGPLLTRTLRRTLSQTRRPGTT